MSRRNLILILLAGLMVGVGLLLLKPALDRDHRSNLGYLEWKLGFGNYSSDYAELIIQDREFKGELKGADIADFVEDYGIELYDGHDFPISSYRGNFLHHLGRSDPDVRCYWFDLQANDFGYCFLVRNGKIEALRPVKG